MNESCHTYDWGMSHIFSRHTDMFSHGLTSTDGINNPRDAWQHDPSRLTGVFVISLSFPAFFHVSNCVNLPCLLPCVAVCCCVLPCVAVCCRVLPFVAVRDSVLQLCCSVLNCVQMCCSVLQWHQIVLIFRVSFACDTRVRDITPAAALNLTCACHLQLTALLLKKFRLRLYCYTLAAAVNLTSVCHLQCVPFAVHIVQLRWHAQESLHLVVHFEHFSFFGSAFVYSYC